MFIVSYQVNRQVMTTAVLLSALVGCSSTSDVPKANVIESGNNSLSHFPADSYGNLLTETDLVENGILDLQLALANRNLYQTKSGNISILNQQCGIDVIAKRGHAEYPENTVTALQHAALGGYDGAVISAQVTQDNYWVSHSDTQTGRAADRYDGKRFKFNRIDADDWNTLYARDREGRLTKERPAYLIQMLREWNQLTTLEEPLNIEISGNASELQLRQLDMMVRGQLATGHYFYSAKDFASLRSLRQINPRVYLGYVWEPHPTSINVLRRDMKKAAGSDALVKQNARGLNYLDRREDRARNKRRANAKNAASTRRYLGANSGLHVDIRSYQQYATIESRSRQAGLARVSTYSINGAKYHADNLKKIKRVGRPLPDEAIINTTKYGLCSVLVPTLTAAKKPTSALPTSTSSLAKLIGKLPNDADFSQLSSQIDYVESAHYLTNLGRVKQLPVAGVVKKKPRAKVVTHSATFTISEDESFELKAQAVQISVPN